MKTIINYFYFIYYRRKGRRAAKKYNHFIQYLTPSVKLLAESEGIPNITKFIDNLSQVKKCKKELKKSTRIARTLKRKNPIFQKLCF